MISSRQLQAAVEVARLAKRPLDKLPYTAELEDSLCAEFRKRLGTTCTPSEAFQWMISARKRGLLRPDNRKEGK